MFYINAIFLYERRGKLVEKRSFLYDQWDVSLRPIDRMFRLMRQVLLKVTIAFSYICLIKLFFNFYFH